MFCLDIPHIPPTRSAGVTGLEVLGSLTDVLLGNESIKASLLSNVLVHDDFIASSPRRWWLAFVCEQNDSERYEQIYIAIPANVIGFG